MREKWRFNLRAELIADGRAPIESAQTPSCAGPLAVIPRTEHDENFVLRVVRLQRGIFSLRAPHVFLIPVAADFQRGNFHARFVRLDGAGTPESVIAGMSEKCLPGGK